MQKLFLLLPFLALGACTPKYSEHIYVADYSKYVQSGFRIYPIGTDIKEKSYVPVADLQLVFYAGRKSKEAIESGLTPAKLYDGSSIYVPTEEYMTGKAVQEAQKHNANGIVNYQVVTVRSAKGNIIRYEAQGTAVRIE